MYFESIGLTYQKRKQLAEFDDLGGVYEGRAPRRSTWAEADVNLDRVQKPIAPIPPLVEPMPLPDGRAPLDFEEDV